METEERVRCPVDERWKNPVLLFVLNCRMMDDGERVERERMIHLLF
jgi:hypothetical protein